MADQRNGGINARPLDETIAGTGPGIPDDSLAPGQEALPEPPSDEKRQRIADALRAKEDLAQDQPR